MLEPGFHGDRRMLQMGLVPCLGSTALRNTVSHRVEASLSAGEGRARFPALISPFSCPREGKEGEMFLPGAPECGVERCHVKASKLRSFSKGPSLHP